MTSRTPVQERMVQNIVELHEKVQPVLKRLREDFEQAEYIAKHAVREAVAAAQGVGVPFSHIAKEGLGMGYSTKAKDWLAPPRSVTVDEAETATKVVVDAPTGTVSLSVDTVVRDPKTGVYVVTYDGTTYSVAAVGPDTEPWSSAAHDVPQAVYDLIKKHNPNWVLLED
jgi:hypothetical protein